MAAALTPGGLGGGWGQQPAEPFTPSQLLNPSLLLPLAGGTSLPPIQTNSAEDGEGATRKEGGGEKMATGGGGFGGAGTLATATAQGGTGASAWNMASLLSPSGLANTLISPSNFLAAGGFTPGGGLASFSPSSLITPAGITGLGLGVHVPLFSYRGYADGGKPPKAPQAAGATSEKASGNAVECDMSSSGGDAGEEQKSEAGPSGGVAGGGGGEDGEEKPRSPKRRPPALSLHTST